MGIFEAGHTQWDVVLVFMFLCYVGLNAYLRRRDRKREAEKKRDLEAKHIENKKLIAQVIHEVRPNSGSSLADAVNRIEAGQKELDAKVTELSNELATHAEYAEPLNQWVEREMDYEQYYTAPPRRSRSRAAKKRPDRK